MRVDGRRIHIAGSANHATGEKLLHYGHSLIEEVVRALARKGATFAVQPGREPHAGREAGPPLVFDWTVIAALNNCLHRGAAIPARWHGRVLATIATEKTDSQVPEDRRALWEELLARDAVQLEHVEPGWASGAVRRLRLGELGDVLLLLSGGEGVEHLAQEYVLQGKPVIPFDLNLGASSDDGSGGAARLAKEMRAHPERFFELSDLSAAGVLITRMATRQGNAPVADVAQAVIELIEAIEPPTAFYVRLLDDMSSQYPAVEQFFRKVVDPMVERAGYRAVEMGRSPTTHAWMNEQIFSTLHHSALAVVDLTGLRPNCFMELGYALGRARRVILTSQKGTDLPFDPKMIDCHFWDETSIDGMRIEGLEKYWRRNISRPPLVKPRGLL